MRAIILSAGQGSRLLPLTAERPKCLIEFSGRTLLDWQIDALAANGVREIVVVVGFQAAKVEAHLAGRNDAGVKITTLFNPFFQVADNLGSVWLTRPYMMQGDFLILNGDTLVTPELVADVLAGAREGINVTIDVKPTYDADDMKVVKTPEGRLLAIGKTLPLDQVNAESIGFLVFKGWGATCFADAVDAVMHTAEGVKSWYLRVIGRIAETHEVNTVSIEGHSWGEVDFPADVARAQALTALWAGGEAEERRIA
ncbi:sugar phosphate nucleotidyltransferase [Pedomonas sp. V897]|uniref:phosphocholine cytidylyltransferase family protein n=1 Tax=Pedomonas sp. V897 TaxID=3446482 RepID=UPI003EE36FA6